MRAVGAGLQHGHRLARHHFVADGDQGAYRFVRDAQRSRAAAGQLDGEDAAARHRAGEGDPSGRRRPHRRAHRRGQVHSPVPRAEVGRRGLPASCDVRPAADRPGPRAGDSAGRGRVGLSEVRFGGGTWPGAGPGARAAARPDGRARDGVVACRRPWGLVLVGCGFEEAAVPSPAGVGGGGAGAGGSAALTAEARARAATVQSRTVPARASGPRGSTERRAGGAAPGCRGVVAQ